MGGLAKPCTEYPFTQHEEADDDDGNTRKDRRLIEHEADVEQPPVQQRVPNRKRSQKLRSVSEVAREVYERLILYARSDVIRDGVPDARKIHKKRHRRRPYQQRALATACGDNSCRNSNQWQDF